MNFIYLICSVLTERVCVSIIIEGVQNKRTEHIEKKMEPDNGKLTLQFEWENGVKFYRLGRYSKISFTWTRYCSEPTVFHEIVTSPMPCETTPKMFEWDELIFIISQVTFHSFFSKHIKSLEILLFLSRVKIPGHLHNLPVPFVNLDQSQDKIACLLRLCGSNWPDKHMVCVATRILKTLQEEFPSSGVFEVQPYNYTIKFLGDNEAEKYWLLSGRRSWCWW